MTHSKYSPELGQALFGNPTSEYECPDFIEAGLRYLDYNIEIYCTNLEQVYISPFENRGANINMCDVFEVNSYYWGDDEELKNRPNFKCGDFEVRWYKYLGRGMSMNQEIDANRFFEIIDKCLDALQNKYGEET